MEQEKRWVVHYKYDLYDVYIGRPSKWGNPFSHIPGKGSVLVSSRMDAYNCFASWLKGESYQTLLPLARRGILNDIEELEARYWPVGVSPHETPTLFATEPFSANCSPER